jgi:hypothetical protein
MFEKTSLILFLPSTGFEPYKFSIFPFFGWSCLFSFNATFEDQL